MFLHRKVTQDYYHAIYIDTTRTSIYYTHLTNFNFDKYANDTYQSTYKYIRESYTQRHKKAIKFPENWLPVYSYKNQYYLYAPSEWGNAGRRLINDSSFVYWGMEGPVPCPLKSFKQITKSKYNLKFINTFDNNVSSTTLIIHIIDSATKLSVFEFPQEKDQSRYELYIPVENAKKFDLIVNYCNNQKQMEFNFDKTDFASLLKTAE